MATSKPALEFAWAESGSKSDPGSTKTQAGFGAEIPTAEAHNWIWNRSDEFLKHVNENGLPVWDASTDYTLGALTLRSGALYGSIQTPNINQTPGSSPTYWTLLSELFNSPTSDEKAAFAGTDGSPSVANKYVTDSDPRLAPAVNVVAWINFDGTGTISIRNSFNVASISDLGTGAYRVTFTNAVSANSCVLVTATDEASVGDPNVGGAKLNGTSSVDIVTDDSASGTYKDSEIISVAVIE